MRRACSEGGTNRLHADVGNVPRVGCAPVPKRVRDHGNARNVGGSRDVRRALRYRELMKASMARIPHTAGRRPPGSAHGATPGIVGLVLEYRLVLGRTPC